MKNISQSLYALISGTSCPQNLNFIHNIKKKKYKYLRKFKKKKSPT